MHESPPKRGPNVFLWGLNLVVLALGIWLTTQWKPSHGKFPAAPINLVVPFGAGGGSDVQARVFKQAINDHNLLGQPLVIHNRGGAGATIGSRYVRDSAPDGYTMLFLHDAIITAKQSGMVRYGPEAFEPVACTGEAGMVIAVAANSPIKTLKDLVEAARNKPGELSFAVNRGALTHVAGLLLEQTAPGVKFQFPQSGGGNDRFLDLIGNHVDATGFSMEEFMRYRVGDEENAPELRGLAYLDAQRNPALPELPTALEQGYDITIINRYYWWVPKGTPPERIEVLANALKAALQTDYVKQQMANMYCELKFLTGDELKAQVAKTEQTVAQVEFSHPEDVPDMQQIAMVAISVLLIAWVIQTGHHTQQFTTIVAFAGCLLLGYLREEVNGWGWFVAIAGFLLLIKHLSSLLKEPLAAKCSAWTLGYVLALTVGGIDFRLLTILYVLAIGGTLSEWNSRRLPVLALIAQSLSFGVFAVFTFLFEVPLPA